MEVRLCRSAIQSGWTSSGSYVPDALTSVSQQTSSVAHLAKLVQLALAIRLMAVAVSPVPVSLVLRSRDTWQHDAVIWSC